MTKNCNFQVEDKGPIVLDMEGLTGKPNTSNENSLQIPKMFFIDKLTKIAILSSSFPNVFKVNFIFLY